MKMICSVECQDVLESEFQCQSVVDSNKESFLVAVTLFDEQIHFCCTVNSRRMDGSNAVETPYRSSIVENSRSKLLRKAIGFGEHAGKTWTMV